MTRPFMSHLNLPFIAYTNGVLLVTLAAILALVGVTAQPHGAYDPAFISAAAATLFFGGLLVTASRNRTRGRMSLHSGYLITFSCWVTLSLFATLPLYFGATSLSFTDAVFETVSALTTTGSTVLTGLDTMPRDLLLWRSMLQWLGGIGIVVMAIAILPFLRVGGMSLFKSESSDISDKMTARLDEFVKVTIVVYTALTGICAVLLRWAGMSWFDAVNHAMTTISTGGFSTHDASIGHFNSPLIEFIVMVFMLAGAMPLIMYAYFFLARRKEQPFVSYSQVFGLLTIWIIALGSVTFWNWHENGMAFLSALRVTAFNITSVLTDTGFASADFSTWGHFPIGVFFFLFFVGGCAGSTSGAIKIFRWQILFKGLYLQFKRNLSPHTIFTLRYAGRIVDDRILHGIRSFLFLYLMTFALFSLAMMGFGLDFLGSVSSVAQAMANAGPALTPALGPAGNFSSLPDGAKWLLDLAMIIGRLEMFTVYALLLPSFWRP